MPGVSVDGACVDCHEHLMVRVGGEILIKGLPSGPSHLLKRGRVQEEASDLRGQVFRIARVEAQSVAAVRDEFGPRSQAWDDDRGAPWATPRHKTRKSTFLTLLAPD